MINLLYTHNVLKDIKFNLLGDKEINTSYRVYVMICAWYGNIPIA